MDWHDVLDLFTIHSILDRRRREERALTISRLAQAEADRARAEADRLHQEQLQAYIDDLDRYIDDLQRRSQAKPGQTPQPPEDR